MPVPPEIKELVERFDQYNAKYTSNSYNETQVRREFIDPFFKALGWDIDNKYGYDERYKEVIHEDAIKVGSKTKAPDYSFRVGGLRKFFVEAKKPAVNLKENPEPAYQLRRYAWSAKLPISILTDFEEFIVFDCTKKPSPNDKSSLGRIEYYTYKDYIEKWDEIVSKYSKDAIYTGKFDDLADSLVKKKGGKGTAGIDDEFLAEIEGWRDILAKNIALRNTELSVRELNLAVQKIIDRIVFLRICEDRGIEEYGQLKKKAEGKNVYENLIKLFIHADDKYNSGLFHFRKEEGNGEPDILTTSLKVDDKILKQIINHLYYPDSPYEFSVIPSDILGQVYEQFLGKVIRLTASHKAKIEEKPEVKKAGGVFYTPTYIVDYIVKNTVGKLVEGKSPKDVSKLNIIDPACGSGSFLLGAYQYLLDWHVNWYMDNLVPLMKEKRLATDPEVRKLLPAKPSPKTKKRGKKRAAGSDYDFPIYQMSEDDWRLTSDEKKRILLNNIYGVDIDQQAVEVTKLSLLLKVLEGEKGERISKQLTITQERVLPSLHKNIKCGNSLIESDIYSSVQMTFDDDEEFYRINAFDWNREFPDIFEKGGFDAVIGNPPYGAYIPESAQNYLKQQYKSSVWRGESYTIFVEKGINLLKYSGLFGFIIPDTYLNLKFTSTLRKFMFNNSIINEVVSLPSKVFSGATVDTTLLFVEKQHFIDTFYPNDIIVKLFNKKLEISSITNPQKEFRINTVFWYNNDIFLIHSNRDEINLISALEKKCVELNEFVDMFYGIKAYQVGKGKPPQTEKIRDEKPFTSTTKIDDSYFPFYDGKHIGRYELLWSENNWIKYGDWLAEPRKPEKFEGEKILIRKIIGKTLIATYVPITSYCNTLLYVVKLNNDVEFEYQFLLGLLNSKFIGWYYRKKFQISEEDTFPQIMIKDILKFPIPKTDKKVEKKMASVVENMLELHKKLDTAKLSSEKEMILRRIDATDAEIDRLVYNLYGLTDEEIAIVEG